LIIYWFFNISIKITFYYWLSYP